MANASKYRCMVADPHSHQLGFAMPLALVAIALLSVITLAGYRAVTSAVEIASVVQENTQTELGFFSAETESVFTFLTSRPVQSGILTGSALTADQNVENILFGLGSEVDVDALAASEFWRASGQARISTTNTLPVTVIYNDASGFAPFSTLTENEIATVLRIAGFDSAAAVQLAARISDYQDHDTRRRFRGAERAEYRLYGAAAPTNSPLRAPGELASVLGFADTASIESWKFLVEYTRFGGFGRQFKPLLGPTVFAEFLETMPQSVGDATLLESVSSRDIQPTSTARFLLAYRLQSGLTRRRAIEIMRTANAADTPFRRIPVYDKAEYEQGDATPANEQNGLAPVFPAVTGLDSR